MADFTAGQILAAADLNAAINEVDINPQSGSSYTLALTDAGDLISLTASSGTATVIVPPNSSVAFGSGATVGILAAGTAICVVAPGSGVTLESYGTARTLVGKGAVAVLIKTGTDEWYLSGGIRV